MESNEFYKTKYLLLKKRFQHVNAEIRTQSLANQELAEKATFWEEQARTCSSSRGDLAKSNFENKKTITSLNKKVNKYEGYLALFCQLFNTDDIELILPYIASELERKQIAIEDKEQELKGLETVSRSTKFSIDYDTSTFEDMELPKSLKKKKFNR